MGTSNDSIFANDEVKRKAAQNRLEQVIGPILKDVKWSEMASFFGFDNFECETDYGWFHATADDEIPLLFIEIAECDFDSLIPSIIEKTDLQAIYFDLEFSPCPAGMKRGNAPLVKRFKKLKDRFTPRAGCHWLRNKR